MAECREAWAQHVLRHNPAPWPNCLAFSSLGHCLETTGVWIVVTEATLGSPRSSTLESTDPTPFRHPAFILPAHTWQALQTASSDCA
ncbi:hypothetical protein WJX72_003140 [[Myrmecia] bisecta]|uniref:Uncharacterized protein n=1 Tax=[Myrmecia] bisecta TaxID=41462 RepID=A0AAW1PAW3_9CHLO